MQERKKFRFPYPGTQRGHLSTLSALESSGELGSLLRPVCDVFNPKCQAPHPPSLPSAAAHSPAHTPRATGSRFLCLCFSTAEKGFAHPPIDPDYFGHIRSFSRVIYSESDAIVSAVTLVIINTEQQ